jgi:multidrug efflux system outer membrane protein
MNAADFLKHAGFLKRTSAVLLALALAACAAPEFKQPQVDTPAAFKESSDSPVTAPDGTRWQVAKAAEVSAPW